jgi:phage protein D
MANGWQSKSVEQQQAESAAPKISAASGELTAEAKRAEAERKRRLQALEMQRERVLSERTSSPHRRSALELALASIEYELEQLGWSIKL